MGRKGFITGFITATAAIATVAGVAYLFKDEIKSTQTYKDLNDKYDVDNKIVKYSEKAKETAFDLKDKAKVTAADLKTKAENWKAANDDDIFDDDEIILDAEESAEERDYVSIKTDIEEKAEEEKDAAADVAEEAKDAAADVAKEAKDAASDVSEEVKAAVEEIKID